MWSERVTRAEVRRVSRRIPFRSMRGRATSSRPSRYRMSNATYVAGNSFDRRRILNGEDACSRSWRPTKLGFPSTITTISPSRIALWPPTSGWISGYRYVMSYSRRFWNLTVPSGERNARARVPSHFSSKMCSSESNGSGWRVASIGWIFTSKRSAMAALLLRRRDARPQRRHQVLRRRRLRRRGDLDRLPLDFRLDHLEEGLPVPVLVSGGIEVRDEGLDEVHRELHFRLRDRDRLRRGRLRRRLHFVRVVEGREDERPVHGAEGDEMLLSPQGRLREGYLPRSQEGLPEQLEGLHARLQGAEEVRGLVEQGADVPRLDEPVHVDVLARLHPDALDLVVRQDHVLRLPHEIALHHLLRVHGDVVHGAHVRPLQGRTARGMEGRERDVLRVRRRVQLHGDVHEAERDAAAPDCSRRRHGIPAWVAECRQRFIDFALDPEVPAMRAGRCSTASRARSDLDRLRRAGGLARHAVDAVALP